MCYCTVLNLTQKIKRGAASHYVIKDWTPPTEFDQNIVGGSDSAEWTLETIAVDSAQSMLAEEGKSLSGFKLPLSGFHKDQFIQNYLMYCYVATEGDFLPERQSFTLNQSQQAKPRPKSI